MNNNDMPRAFESYENDWLEVKYVSPQDMQEKQKKENKQSTFAKLKNKFGKKQKQNENAVVKSKGGFARVFKKSLKPVGICAVVALVLAGMLFVENGFVGDVFGFAKDDYTSSGNQNVTKTMALPANATVSVDGGNVTLTGGTLAVNFLGGKVSNVTENSVTVSCNDGFDVIYSNLNEVLVGKDDVVSQYQVLGKYTESAVVNLVQNGQPITNVSANGYVLSW
ncbi:MAG: hypothetical protein IKA90_01160 [Clostridia bacterium]|nr:hypothetical protein [Clostridia bacterium]